MQLAPCPRAWGQRPQCGTNQVREPVAHQTSLGFVVQDESLATALEMLEDELWVAAAARAALVHRLCVGRDVDPPSSFERPPTEVGLLGIEPVASVESAELFERAPSHQEARPDHKPTTSGRCREARESKRVAPRSRD